MKFGVLGAGAIGSYLGVRISAAGHPTVLIGRRWLADRRPHLVAGNLRGQVQKPLDLEVDEDAARLADADVVLVTVKSIDTPAIVEALLGRVRRDTLIVSFQNGVRNVEVLRKLETDVVPGIVSFNVIWDGARVQQATSGPILLGPSSHPGLGELVAALQRSGEQVAIKKNIDAFQMGKLLINLNNGICAIAGLPIGEMLRSHALRSAYAICIREGLSIAKKAGRPVRAVGVLSPALIAHALILPDAIVRLVAGGIISIDPRARSSTLQDLDKRKKTEIDHLNGEIVRLANAHGLVAPANSFVTEYVHRLEAMQGNLQFLGAEEVVRGVGSDHGRSS